MQECWSFTCCLSCTLGSSSKCSQLKPFLYIGIKLVDVHLNWFNWLHFLILEGGLLIILINCMHFCVTIPRLRIQVENLEIFIPSEIAAEAHFHAWHGTKINPVFLPADEKASQWRIMYFNPLKQPWIIGFSILIPENDTQNPVVLDLLLCWFWLFLCWLV